MPPIDKDAKIAHLQVELEALMAVLELREQEDTWEKMERGIIRFTSVTKGGGYKHLSAYVDGMGKMGAGLKLGQCMLSDRGRLSGVATELLQTLAPRLGPAFQPLVPVYLAPLVELLGRPNKVFLKRAEKCLWTIISNCHLPSILFELRRGLGDEAATCRRGCAAGFERALIDWERPTFGERGVGMVEEALRKVGADKDVEVRATGKRIWTKFSEIWPERVDDFSAPLTPTIRRYLGVSAALASSQAGPSKPRPPPLGKAPPRPAPALSASTSSLPAAAPTQMAPPPPPPLPAPAPAIMPPLEPAPLPRVQALGGRAVRPPLLSTQSELPPTIAPLAEPARRRSPGKVPFPGPPVSISSIESEAVRNRALSSRAPRYPPGALNQHGRSISHSVLPSLELPSYPSEAASPLLMDAHIRPAFPTSFSTTSIPTSTSTDHPSESGWQPSRRFPGVAPIRGARPVLPIPAEEIDIPETPSILRGAVRPAPQPRRDLGQAQRRVFTAPIPDYTRPEDATPNPPAFLRSSTSVRDKIPHIPEVEAEPAPSNPPAVLRSSTSVRDRIQQMEKKAAEVEAAGIPLPCSPTAERFGARSREGTPKKLKLEVESPTLPVLARSLRHTAVSPSREGGGGRQMLRDEEMPEDQVGDVTLGPRDTVETRRDTSVPAAQEGDGAGKVEVEAIPEPQTSASSPLVVVALSSDTVDAATSPSPQLVDVPSPSDIVATALPTHLTLDAPISKSHQITTALAGLPKPNAAPKPIPAAVSTATTDQPRSRKPPLPPVAPRTRLPSGTADRLPPVTTTRTAKPRIPAQDVRKPFRPTTKAPLPPQPSASVPTASSSFTSFNSGKPAPTTTEAAPREPTIRISKPPIPKAGPSARVPSAASTHSSGTTTITTLKPPLPPMPNRAVCSSSNLTKPTAASAHRAVSSAAIVKPSKPISTVPSTSSSASITLPPPVKKDKVKRKAAVPSFRPTRTADASKAAPSLSASTSSSAPSSAALGRSQMKSSTGQGVSVTAKGTGTAGKAGTVGTTAKATGGIVARVKVKPEMIPLPTSPGEKRAKEIPLPASPALEEWVGRVKVKPRPREEASAEEDQRVKVETKGEDRQGSKQLDGGIEAAHLEAATIPLPPSPTIGAKRDSTTPISSPPRSTSTSTHPTSDLTQSPPSTSFLHPAGPGPIHLHSASSAPGSGLTPISKASTMPPISDWSGSESDAESDEITYGRKTNGESSAAVSSSSPVEAEGAPTIEGLTPNGQAENGEEKDLIEFSMSTRSFPFPTISSATEEQGEEVERDLMEFSAASRVTCPFDQDVDEERSAASVDRQGRVEEAEMKQEQGKEGEKDLTEFSAPSRPAYAQDVAVGGENQGMVLEKGKEKGEVVLANVLGSPAGGQRVVLSERNRNGVLVQEELL